MPEKMAHCRAEHYSAAEGRRYRCEILVPRDAEHDGDHKAMSRPATAETGAVWLHWTEEVAIYPTPSVTDPKDPCYWGHSPYCEHRDEAYPVGGLANPARTVVKPPSGPVVSAGGPAVRDSQVGGDHYRKRTIQPWDIWEEYGLDPWRANAVKYLLRAGDKGPAAEDLKKARHYLDKCIEREEGRSADERSI